MLYPNGQRALTFPGTPRAGSLASSGTTAYSGIGGARFNRYVSETYSRVIGAVPSGYGGRAYIPPLKSGGLTAFTGLSITPLATGGLGLPGFGSASLTINFAPATGSLIASGIGTASWSITTNSPLLTASLNAIGSTSFAITSNTPLLGAIARCTGTAGVFFSTTASILPTNDASPLRTATASFAITGSLTPYAIGSMSGSTVDSGVLTPATITTAVWNAVAADYAASGTMGNKVNAAASGGVDYSALGAAVWANATRTLTSTGGSAPTAIENADAVWAKVIEAGLSADDLLRIALAALAGTSQTVGNTVTFKGLDGVTDRIVGSFDTENNRTGAMLDGA